MYAHTNIGKQHQTSGDQEVSKATYLKGDPRGGLLGFLLQVLWLWEQD